MKYGIGLLAAIFLLSGCGNEDNLTEDTPKQSSESVPSEQVTKPVNDKGEMKEEIEKEEGKTSEQVTPIYQVNQTNWKIEPIDGGNKKIALFTIDDAPDHYSLAMANKLKEMDASAIFFVNGRFLESDDKKKVLKQIYDMGFEIGNHTYSHASLPDLDEEQQKEEIIKVNDMVEEITGERPRFFRAPFGANTDFSKQIAKDEKMQLMNWTIGYDWEKQYQNKDALVKIMLTSKELYPGANLLLHDRQWTKEALPELIEGLRAQGYKIINSREIKSF
jgi:peptidoglycan/xylan/chitin deacetylase (PgdA/CDA1 family)